MTRPANNDIANYMDVIDPSTYPDNSKYKPKNIPIEKFIELRRKGLSHSQIAKVLGCSDAASKQRLAAVKEELECSEGYKNNKSAYLNHKQWMLLNSLTPAIVKDMSGLQLVTGAAILYDKQRLEDGRSTGNINVNSQHQYIQDQVGELDRIVQLLVDNPILPITVDKSDNDDNPIIDDNVDISDT